MMLVDSCQIMKTDILKLKRYLKENPKGKISLCVSLGYHCENTILKWITRGKLPRLRRQEILDHIDSNASVAVNREVYGAVRMTGTKRMGAK